MPSLALALVACAGSPSTGFSTQRLSDDTYKVVYIGRAGSTSSEAYQALHAGAESLCHGAYDLEIVSDLLPSFDAPRTVGVGAQGLVKCLH
jgi:hypothetical protein